MSETPRRTVVGLVAIAAAAALVGRTPLPAQTPATDRATPSGVAPLDCTSCHPGVHATMLGGGADVATRCEACHRRAHDAVVKLFTGVGDDSVLHPDRMFLARVECRSCHTDAALAERTSAPRLAAITRACTSCHGVAFANMLPRWSEAIHRRTEAVDAYVAAAAGDGRFAGRGGARALLGSARADLTLVVNGNGLHNVRGADALLRSAVRKVGTAYRTAGLAAPTPPGLGSGHRHLRLLPLRCRSGARYRVRPAVRPRGPRRPRRRRVRQLPLRPRVFRGR